VSHPIHGRARSGPHEGRQRSRPALECLEERALLSAAGTGAFDPTRILVRFRTPEFHQSLLQGTTIGPALDLVPGLYEVRLGKAVSVASALAAYQADPRVLTAEPDYQLDVARIPNNPDFSQQWDLNDAAKPSVDVHATKAWDVTTGTGRTVVALLDTGIDYNHPDLYQNIWINEAEIPLSRRRNLIDVDHDGFLSFHDLNDSRNQGAFKITDVNHDGRIDAADILAPMIRDRFGRDTGQGGWAYPGNVQDGDTAHPNDFIGWNFVNNTNNPFDDNGHGTHVGGTIGATGNDGLGVAGLNWHVRLMPVKFLDASGHGTTAGAIDALNYAVAHGARLSNNSYAGDTFRQIFFDALNAARAHGHVFVAAAGNGSANNDAAPSYPSSYPLDNVVAVAATDRDGNLASFSNYGRATVALAAPGVDVLSTEPGNSYGVRSGTSMATPHVTGVLSLVWDLHPNWTYSQVIHQVLSTVDQSPSLRGKLESGGRLDAARALSWGKPPTRTPGPRVLTSSASGPGFDVLGRVRLTFDRAMDVGSFTRSQARLVGPGGRVVPISGVRVVNGSGDRQFDVFFPTQTAAGSYRLTIGPNLRDRFGNRLDQNGDGVTGQGSRDEYVVTFALQRMHGVGVPSGALLRPGQVTTATLFVSQDLTVADLAVRLSTTIANVGDLFVHLRGPDGRDVLLVSRSGSGGVYRPATSLARIQGDQARGKWTLFVEDRSRRDTGRLLGWSLYVTAGLERA
jgi:subtilisin family serine protease